MTLAARVDKAGAGRQPNLMPRPSLGPFAVALMNRMNHAIAQKRTTTGRLPTCASPNLTAVLLLCTMKSVRSG